MEQRYVVPSLPKGEIESPAWAVLDLLLHAGSARFVSVDEQIWSPGFWQLQPSAAVAALSDDGIARHAGEGDGAPGAGGMGVSLWHPFDNAAHASVPLALVG